MTQRDERTTRDNAKAEVTGAVGTGAIPADALARSPLDADYADHYVLGTGIRGTAETYARAMFGDAPTIAERFIWSVLLQMDLEPEVSSRTVAGWRILENTPDSIRLEARSWFLTANLVVHVLDGELSLTTYIRYDRMIGRWVWTPLSAVHRSLVPQVLRDGADRVRRLEG
jgi:hypothetical protein